MSGNIRNYLTPPTNYSTLHHATICIRACARGKWAEEMGSLGTPARDEIQSDCSIRGIEFPVVNIQRAAKGFVERYDVCVGLPTGGRLLVTVLLPASSFLLKNTVPVSNAVHH